MQKLGALEELIDGKKLAIIRVLFNSREELYLRELAKKAAVPVATTYRMLNELSRLKLVRVRAVKRMKLYSIERNDKAQALAPFFKKDIQVLGEFIEMIKSQPGLQAVYLHGEEREDRVNLLLIGEDLDNELLKRAAAEINEQHKFLLSYLSLTLEQYKQMSSMGLWSGTKKVLWERKG